MKKITVILSVLLCCFGCQAQQSEKNKEQEILEPMKIKIEVDGTEITATLYNNATAKDLVSRLPLTVELEDYAGNEKIFYPKPKLATTGAPAGYQASKGDITYYSPWGDIAIFYKDFSYASGLVSVGKIDGNGIDELLFKGSKKVTISLLEE